MFPDARGFIRLLQLADSALPIGAAAAGQFAKFFHRPPDQLGPDHIRRYQGYLLLEENVQRVSALRFFFGKTLKRHYMPEPRVASATPAALFKSTNPQPTHENYRANPKNGGECEAKPAKPPATSH
jgi:hypothetical protein